MTIERKLLGTSPSGGATDVAEVFSTYLYTGNSGTNAINNGIDLAGEGGMVWFKYRNVTNNHYIVDTERGASKVLYGLGTDAETTSANSVTSFNSNGFTLGADGTDGINKNTRSQVSWAFRKKSRFFSCVTYSGNGTSQVISHGLDGPVGMIIVKSLTESRGWNVYHKSLGTGKHLELNLTDGENTGSVYITSVGNSSFTVGSAYDVNNNGQSYVAYLFADNSSEDADDQMIKCGSYTGNGSVTGPVVDLGWEPQFLITKVVNSNHWNIWDSTRGITTDGGDKRLYTSLNNAENESEKLQLTPTGFQIKSTSISINTSGVESIYMAIRAPMMVEPKAAIDVFNIDTAGANGDGVAPNYRSTFPVDFALHVRTGSGGPQAYSRQTASRYLYTDSANDEASTSQSTWDFMNGWYNQNSSQSTSTGQVVNMWKRAKGFFDVVAYTGTGAGGRTVNHSLGVTPEMIWVKKRTPAEAWTVYHEGVDASIPGEYFLALNETDTRSGSSRAWNNVAPTSSLFTLGDDSISNGSGHPYIAYLFTTLAGISKVGSYTGNGSSQTISCGFSAGTRFLLIKRSDADGAWYLWDSVRGIVSGNDPWKALNTNDAQTTNTDLVDPHNSGFIVNQSTPQSINVSGGNYIFYAIA